MTARSGWQIKSGTPAHKTQYIIWSLRRTFDNDADQRTDLGGSRYYAIDLICIHNAWTNELF